ncbi:MAG: NAD(P)-dependent oxidoreductase [Chloroflexi bacterium]|nr:NAD(P)-dependent oxidoreductase [Chloroflexota bacterium]
MTILITGGSGYIGRWLARELDDRGIRVVAADLQPPAAEMKPALPASACYVAVDVTNRAVFRDAAQGEPFSAIVHLAGIVTMGCERDPDLGMRVNLGGTHNALEVARLAGIPRVIFASTISVYGPGLPQPIAEQSPALPLTWYGQSKLMAEQLGLYYHRRFRLDFRAARLAAIVGPSRIVASGSATMYTSLILERAARGEPYEIDVDEEAATPVCYAKDAARALAALATVEAAPQRIYNIGTGQATAAGLVEIARRRAPDAAITFRPDPAMAAVGRISRDWDLSIEAARRELGWVPAYTVETMADDLMAIARETL